MIYRDTNFRLVPRSGTFKVFSVTAALSLSYLTEPSFAYNTKIPRFVSYRYQATRSIYSAENYIRQFMTSRDSNIVGVSSQSEALNDESEEKHSVQCFDPPNILHSSEHFLVVEKPPSVVCHHSDYTGSRSGAVNEIPMLQRVRDTIGRRVNLVHRLDRGASGCLLMTYSDERDLAGDSEYQATAILSEALADKVTCSKTYIAIVRGEGIVRERNFMSEGWFSVDRPIKSESGVEKEAKTWFRFVAGQGNHGGELPDKARASIVLARPESGRWHQIRKHLSGLSHPILGDSTHGSSQTNREWKEKRNMPPARTCLHLCKLTMAPTSVSPDGIDITSKLPSDMRLMLEEELPEVLEAAIPILLEEGIDVV